MNFKTVILTKNLFYYYSKALKATGNHDDQLALCWRVVADASRNLSKQSRVNEILPSRGTVCDDELNHSSLSWLETQYYLNQQPLFDQVLTENSLFNKESMQEIVKDYSALIVPLLIRNANSLNQDIEQAHQAAIKYRLLAPEVSFFAEEAAIYFQKAQEIVKTRALLEAYRLQITAYAAVEVALTYLHVEASQSWNNKILLYHWKEAARYGEESFHARIKAAEATHQKDEIVAIKWSLTAAAATQVGDAHAQLLELFPRGDQYLIAHWNNLLHAAEEAMQLRKKRASLKKENIHWDHAAFWSEHYYDCYTRVIENYIPTNPSASGEWEKVAKGAKHVASLWKHFEDLETKQRFTLACLCYKRRALYAEQKNRRMISDLS